MMNLHAFNNEGHAIEVNSIFKLVMFSYITYNIYPTQTSLNQKE